MNQTQIFLIVSEVVLIALLVIWRIALSLSLSEEKFFGMGKK